ncbi:uncharacterized protein [Elaeis guineensis]|uniref:Uncharacterized protein At1g76660 isoform X1 n=1 Tax=Elaeis guineensis var. tenera TaxID=51953 RepID=A0A6J0PS00_ELAGV|nr:uncharacterized protein At1g76660 isoform X2 [Elaeis guineensis]XP_019710831.1 uncharacterized protein At1g76660 isoform X1 [Elaeis guineensis]XP_029116042.1 uncharacterized protein At1g76660 isoform X1 [Elaeis guineensis]
MNNSAETVNAAAAAIVTAERRVQQVTVPRRRWGACFSLYWCFGSQRHGKRVSHAVLVPQQTLPRSDAPARENPIHPPAFVAPPSSPASFLPSEPPSATQSPAGPRFLANSYSPSGPVSIFAIGPYAHETQLVSPPVFSTFTTEPSTASFTPPPEPVHLTNPSSPEVPFARLLTSSLNSNCKQSEASAFQSYQFYPGSPIGHLISPRSACSGASSPFPDVEFHSSAGGSFPSFPVSEPPKILSAEGIAVRKLIPRHARNGGSLLDGQITAAAPRMDSAMGSHNNEHAMDHRGSSELTEEEFARCLGKKTATSGETNSGSSQVATAAVDQITAEANKSNAICVDETYHDLPEIAQPSTALSAVKEFKFDNADGAPLEPSVGSDWWANEKVAGTASEPHKNWAYFPMIQPGVS